ncbi:MAG: hypothetical protein R2862_08950 [Thermoanaerobaculia bacterium]
MSSLPRDGAKKRGGDDGFADVWKRDFAWEYRDRTRTWTAWQQLDRYRADLENRRSW